MKNYFDKWQKNITNDEFRKNFKGKILFNYFKN